MSTSQEVPWKRIIAEGTAIVVSILLAFSIDAWWEVRTQRQALTVTLENLSQDFEQNLLLIDATANSHKQIESAAEQLLKYTGPDDSYDIDSSELSNWILELTSRPVLRPAQGTLNSLLDSDLWALLDNSQLQAELAGWPALVEHVNSREQQAIGTINSHLVPRIWELTPIRSIDAISPGFEHVGPSRFPTNYNALLADMVFEGIVGERWWEANQTLIQIATLRESTARIMKLIEEEL